MRYLPDRALPSARYVPRHTGTRPVATPQIAPLAPERWREDDGYLWGAELYDAGFPWEAHEAWEAVWARASGAQRDLLQALIQCAAAEVKLLQGKADIAANVRARACERLARIGPMMGLDPGAYAARFLAWPLDWASRPRLELAVGRILSTERLHVRRAVRSDLADLVALCGDPEVMAYVGDNRPMAPDKVAAWLERTLVNYETRPHGFGMWVLHERAGGGFAGYAGILYPEGKPELVYTLHKRCWGRGLGSEIAAAVLTYALAHVPLVTATVDPANLPSRRILARIGMVFVRAGNDENGLPTEWWQISRRASP